MMQYHDDVQILQIMKALIEGKGLIRIQIQRVKRLPRLDTVDVDYVPEPLRFIIIIIIIIIID